MWLIVNVRIEGLTCISIKSCRFGHIRCRVEHGPAATECTLNVSLDNSIGWLTFNRRLDYVLTQPDSAVSDLRNDNVCW